MTATPSLLAVREEHARWLLIHGDGKNPRVEDMARVLSCSYSTARGLMSVAGLPSANGSVPVPRRKVKTVSSPASKKRYREPGGRLAKLTRERDEARSHAYILAHAFEHDSRPPILILIAAIKWKPNSTIDE